MKPISDRTLGELLRERLVELQLFQLMARRLGPGQPVFLSAYGFDEAGEMYRVSGEAETLELALLDLFATAATARRNRQRRKTPAAPVRPRMVRMNVERIGTVRHFAREVTARPSQPIDVREHRRRLALEIADRIGAVTATSLRERLGLTDEAENCAAILSELAEEGRLARSKRFGFVLPERGDPAC